MNVEFEQKEPAEKPQATDLRSSDKDRPAPEGHRNVTLDAVQQKTRRKMARDIILVLLVVTGAILALSIVQGWNLRQDISRALVKEATVAIREKFNDLATPIQRDLMVYRKWGESNLLDLGDPGGLSQKFIPLLELQPMVTGLILADTGGAEYFFYKDGDTWVSRSAENYQSEMEVTLNRWNTQGKQIETWQEKRRFDPRTRGWFTGALQSIQTGNLFWTEPYRFMTARKVGITASVGWRGKSGDSRLYVAAVDILLDDIFNFVAGLQITPNARVLLVRNDGSVMAIPESHSGPAAGTGTGASFVAPEDMKEGASREALVRWKKSGTLELEVIEFSSEGDTWWAGFKPMQDAASSGWIAVVIPEKDLIGNLKLKRRNIVILVTVILMAGVLLIGYLVRRYSIQFKTLGVAGVEKNIESDMTRLIAVGENSRIEFKSTLRVNLNTGKRDKAIELSWLKSVAAFMNSEGDAFM